jgi:pSer/pThr/pTyr-binding forkhead associated (FHA) protein
MAREGASMATLFCTQCGQENVEGGQFCVKCGAPLPRTGAPVTAERPAETTSTISVSAVEALDVDADEAQVTDSALDSLPPGSALLVVKRGPNAGSRFLLDKEVTTVGRHPESDIFLDDVTVSRRHAEFDRGAGAAFSVRDVGSLNGTYVNRERIDEATLAIGDEVQVGKFRLVYLATPVPGG